MNDPTVHISSTKTEANQSIAFIDHELPALPAGEYEINVHQHVTGTRKEKSSTDNNGAFDDTLSTSRELYIGAPRVRLDPTTVYSVYPPRAYSGDVTNCLPNVVLADHKLPWLRTSGGESQNADSIRNPWLALIMFHNDDPIPDLKQVNLGYSEKGILPEKMDLEPGEKSSDICQVIDVPVDLFNQVAPTLKDLNYLSHIREVDVTAKAAKLDYDYHPQGGLKLKTSEPKKKFSVVICNRLPKPDSRCHMFLVSLENMGEYLPESNGNSKIKSGIDAVRLVVLESWEFYATAFQKRLVEVVGNLNRNARSAMAAPFSAPITLRLPDVPTTKTSTDATPTEVINKSFSMGFVPLDHETRLGGNTVSWQRSPLVPYQVNETLSFPASCSDHLMHYNPENGMFDTTYAAAWQLGRLLCIQNKGFAYQLYQWKKGKTRMAANQVEQEALLDASMPDSAKRSGAPFSEQLVESMLSPMLQGFFGEGVKQPGVSANLREIRQQALESLLSDPVRLAGVTQADDTDEDTIIINWLSRLHLLQGVPFRYLVPHQDLLPAESIKFFYVDPNYVNALIDGAFSIGRSLELDMAVDRERLSRLKDKVKHRARQWRRRIFKQHDLEEETDGVVTGFLLNSQLVSDFPGLEVTAKNSDGTTLSILRMERISPEVLLFLVAGEIDSIEFAQPPEGLFFGLNGTPGSFNKTLRYQTNSGSGSSQIGEVNPEETVDTIPFRNDAVNTVQIATLSESIGEKVLPKGASDPLTSAEFALQMTQGAEQVTLTKKT